MRTILAVGISFLLVGRAGPVEAQVQRQPGPQPGDGASIEALVTALYQTVTRTKGQPFDWPRLRALFLGGAQLIPATQPPSDSVPRYTVESFITMIDASWARTGPIGGDRDQGFFERQVSLLKEEYGDVATAFSTYEKGVPVSGAPVYRGINSMLLVRTGGRWFIASMAWDEENGAGPVPPKYLGGAAR